MNGAWEPDAVLVQEVVITWNSMWGIIYFEVLEAGSLQMISRHPRLLLPLDGG